MLKGSGRVLGFIVLGGGLLAGLAAGLTLFLLLSQWLGSRAMTPATITPEQAQSSAWPFGQDPSIELTLEAPLQAAPLRGSLAPNFELAGLEGERISLSDYHGSVVLINFWATWCTPCRAEMPMFQEYYERYADQGLEILAVNFDSPLRDVMTFRFDHDLGFPILIDESESVVDLYRIWSFPTTFVIDREGIIRFVHYGSMRGTQLENYLHGVGINS